MDTDRLGEIVAGIPAGHWMSYADVCAALGLKLFGNPLIPPLKPGQRTR